MSGGQKTICVNFAFNATLKSAGTCFINAELKSADTCFIYTFIQYSYGVSQKSHANFNMCKSHGIKSKGELLELF